jgi:hypothetical protein
MDSATELILKQKIDNVLSLQGLTSIGGDMHSLRDQNVIVTRETKRDMHSVSKLEKLHKYRDFLTKSIPIVEKYMIDGADINVENIMPSIRPVLSGSEDEIIFRWWNLAWWSLPYERAYGRQMRFIVWDDYHNAPMGLIGLQSPILSWKARDEYLEIGAKDRDYWVNQSMSAQRLGALPPYNNLLGGKLVGMMLTSDTVRDAFEAKYIHKKTLIMDRSLPARILFLTTTGAFGKSSVYDRLKYDGHKVAEFIGMTQGNGTFHVPDELYHELVGFLTANGVDTKRGYGGGPSKKLKLINQAFSRLGIKNGARHGIQRAVYLFPLASNVKEVIGKGEEPKWYFHNEAEMANFWKQRWAIPRAHRDISYRSFKARSVIDDLMTALE